MSTRRERVKQPNTQLNRQLLERETYAKLQEEKRKKSLRKADICTDLSKLVFASVIQRINIMVAIGFIIVVTIGATIVYLHDRKTLLKD